MAFPEAKLRISFIRESFSYSQKEQKLFASMEQKGIKTNMAKRLLRVLREEGIYQRLSGLPRSGWVIRGLGQDAESVMEHSIDVANIVVDNIESAGIDNKEREGAVIMALGHDLAEATVGDITPYNGNKTKDFTKWVKPSEETALAKFRTEKEALEKICKSFPYNIRIVILDLGSEFNNLDRVKSNRASFVRYCDIFAVVRKAKFFVDEGNGGVKMPKEWLASFRMQIESEIPETSPIRALALREIQ